MDLAADQSKSQRTIDASTWRNEVQMISWLRQRKPSVERLSCSRINLSNDGVSVVRITRRLVLN